MKTKLLLATIAATCNFWMIAQESRTIIMNNGEELDVIYDNNNPDDFKDITLEVLPLDVGEAIVGAGASYTLRASARVTEAISGSVELRGLYKQQTPSIENVSNEESGKKYWEILALGNYTVFSFANEGKYKVKLMKKGRFYSYVKLPHTAKNEFRLQFGTSYLNRSGGESYNADDQVRHGATSLGFVSVLGGLNYKRSVNTKISGLKSGGERLTITNIFLSKRTWSIYGRVGYTVHSTGDFFANTGVDGSYESVLADESGVDMNYMTLRIGASVRQYLWEDISISFLIEGGVYPGVKTENDPRSFIPCARVGVGYDL